MNLAAKFRDVPIKLKLMLIGLLTSGLALFFISLILATGSWVEGRWRAVSDMTTYAEVIGMNAAPAMLFDDRNAATETLSALAANTDIVDAVIYDKEGRIFARFTAPQHSPRAPMPALNPGTHLLSLNQLVVSMPIRFKGEVLGSIYLESDLRGLYAAILEDIALTFVAALGVFLASIFLFFRLQKFIVGPILDLSKGMQKVAAEQDYAVRVAIHGKDEVGMLARTFNDMLQHIQQRDAELALHRESLEAEVAQRTVSLTEAQRIARLGNWEWDVVNNKLEMSDEIYRIFELTPQQFGSTYEDFLRAVHPQDRQAVDASVRETLKRGLPSNMDYRILLSDGSLRYLHAQMEVFLDKDGHPFGMHGTVQDITEHKQLELQLRESEERFRKAFQYSAIGMALVGLDGRWLKVNDSLSQIVGYPEQELLGKTFQDITHPEDLHADLGFVEQLLAGEIDHYQMEKRYFHKDGHVVWVRLSVSLIRDAQELPIHFVSQIDDITERKLAAQALEQSELKFRTILDATVDGILVADAETHKFVLGNQAICDMLGYTLEELYGFGVADIHPPQALPEVQRQFERQLRGEIRVAPNLPVKRKDGSVFFADVSSSPMELVGHIFLVGVFHDVTERKLAEIKIQTLNEELETKVQERTRQLSEAQEELLRNEKLAVLGQVAGSVGHELRNPLGVMNNAVYFLQTVLTDADEITKEYLNIIKDEIAGAERIVSDLLDSVRTKPPHPEIAGIAELIGQTLARLTIPSHVTVKLDIPATLAPLRVDPLQIHQVFRNLISNGVEAMPDGGTLEIRAVENQVGGTITVSVHDSGSGMTPEQLGKLFQPLFTTKARGIGLGLVVVKNLTQANGGTVKVQSAVGKGTLFSITLPAADEREV